VKLTLTKINIFFLFKSVGSTSLSSHY